MASAFSRDPRDRRADSFQTSDALFRRIRRRRRWWLVAKVLAVLVLLLLGFFIWLQSSYGLRYFFLPLASRQLGAKVTATDGSIHLNGRVVLDNLVVTDAYDQPALSAEHLALRIAPRSLLGGGPPEISEARATAPQVRIVQYKNKSNWDFLKKKAKSGPEPQPQPARPGAGGQTPYPEVNVSLLEVENLGVDYTGGDGVQFQASGLNIVIQSMGRGKTGTFSVQGDGALQRPEAAIKQTGHFTTQGRLTQGADGRLLEWDGALTADLKNLAPDQPGAADVKLHGTSQGTMRAGGSFSQVFDLTAATSQGQAGRFNGKVDWDDAKNVHQAAVDVTGVGREFLNPFLAALGPVQLTESAIDGHYEVSGAGETVKLASTVNGRNLRFRVGSNAAPTPAMDLTFKHQGTYDPRTKRLELDGVDLTLLEGGRQVVQTQLGQPLRFNLGAGSGAADAIGQQAALKVNLNQLGLDALRPWLALAGQPDAGGLESGVLTGQTTINLDKSGNGLALAGELTGSQVRFKQRPGLELEVKPSFKLRLENGFKRLTVDEMAVKIATGGAELAAGDFTGAIELDKQSGNGQAKLILPQALRAAQALGLAQGAGAEVRDGRLELNQKMTFAAGGRLTVEGSGELAGMSLDGAGGKRLELPVSAHYKLAGDGQRYRIETAHLDLGQGGQLDVQGEWPTASQKDAGQLKMNARRVDLTPWLRLRQSGSAGTSPAGAIPAALLVDADELLTAQPGGKVHVEGETRIGPVTVAAAGGGQQSLALTVRHELEKVGEELKTLTLDVTSPAGQGAAGKSAGSDKIHIDGTGTLGVTPKLKLNVMVEALQADPYLALAQGLGGGPTAPASDEKSGGAQSNGGEKSGSGKNGTVKSGVGGAAPASEAPAPKKAGSMVVDAALTIKQASYQQAALSDAKGSLRMENGVTELKLDQAKLNGGALAGRASYDAARIEPRYAWDLTLNQINIQPVVNAVKPDWKDKLTGMADVKSHGSGQGTGEALRRRLQGESSFTITNGEMSNIALLDTLAEQTKMPAFNNLKFFDFSGVVSIADGVATLKDWVERGKEQMLSMEGTVKLDGPYELLIQPGVKSEQAGKLIQDPALQKLLGNAQGYVMFPFQLAIRGEGSNYHVTPQAGAGSIAKNLGPAAREAITGTVQKKLMEKLGLPTGEPPAGATTGTQPTNSGGTQPSTGSAPGAGLLPGLSPGQSGSKSKSGSGAVDQLLQRVLTKPKSKARKAKD